jgi:hypothetical protein
MKENTSSKAFSIRRSPAAFYIVIICCTVAMAGCKAKKALAVRKAADTTAAKPAVDTKLIQINAIKSAQTSFNTFSGKAKTSLSINGDANDVTLNIRIQRDQKIWVSITAIAGIEVARALIRPDSLFMMNRLQSVYLKRPFSYVSQYAGSQVNYKMLESVIIGNAIPEALTESSDFQPANGGTQVTGRLAALVYMLMLGPDNKVNQLNLNNQDEGQTLQVNNSAFIQVANHVVPSEIDMSSTVKTKKITVNLHYVKQEFDQPLDFPFTIPSRYTPAE